MTDDNEAKPDGASEEQPEGPGPADPPARRRPERRDNSEKAVGLEMARLFGMNPKLMMAPKAPPEETREPSEDQEDAEQRD